MRLRHVFAALMLLVPLAACAREGGERLVVTAQDFGFSGVGATIKGGVIDLSFRNKGKAKHEFALINIGGATVEEFKKGFPPVVQGGPFPKFMTNGVVAGDLDPGDSLRTKMTVPAGDYVLVCALEDAPGGSGDEQPSTKPHYDLGMIQPVTVEGDEEPKDIRATGGAFVADDYSFQTPDDLVAGEKTYVFRNAQEKQWHHMVVTKYEDGISSADAEAAFGKLIQTPQGKPPPEGVPIGDDFGGTGIMGPGLAQTTEIEFDPGTYVAACFLQDVTGGPPHAIAYKMYKGFTVEG